MTRKPRPGSRWRIKAGGVPPDGTVEMLSDNGPVFDELVIDGWFHLEQMDRRAWWMQIGDHHVNVSIGRDGKATVTYYDDPPRKK